MVIMFHLGAHFAKISRWRYHIPITYDSVRRGAKQHRARRAVKDEFSEGGGTMSSADSVSASGKTIQLLDGRTLGAEAPMP